MTALKVILVLAYLGIVLWSIRLSLFGKDLQFRRIIGGGAGLVTLLFLLPGIGQVPAGHRGVVLRFGAVTGRVLNEGIYTVTPFVESVELMDVQVHAHKTRAGASSRDLQDVTADIVLNYRVTPATADTVYRDLRREYEERIIGPSVQEAVKAATAQYDAEQLIQQRAVVRGQVETALRERLNTHGITLDAMSITDFSFSKDFDAAIEMKVVAAQSALQAENVLRRIKVEAEQRIATAEAEAKAIKIQAEAITQQGGREYVNLKAIEKWNGVLPTWTGGGGMPFINLGSPDELERRQHAKK